MNNHDLRHRQAHTEERIFFTGAPLLTLQRAVYELCWLFNHGYARHSAIKLVGDHYQLSKRQRLAINRAACSSKDRNARAAKCLTLDKIAHRAVIIDGFNLIITAETAAAGGLLLLCQDNCIRDIASVHGTYRQVHETRQVIEKIGRLLEASAPESVEWLFDKPVSNSGRLAALVRDIGTVQGWSWQAELVDNPDQAIINSEKISISSDSVVLDKVDHWLNLSDYLIKYYFHDAWIIDLSNTQDTENL